MTPSIQKVTLHEVWADNLDVEFAKLSALIDNYRFVAMDTEFPGLVATPIQGSFKSKEDFNYKMLYTNVNLLKVIQVGFVLVNAEGKLPPDGDVWQFNFHFSLDHDMYSSESVELLKTSGLNFARHSTHGIRMEEFGGLLITSGLIARKTVTWLTFQSSFDFGYLIKCILNGHLPQDEKRFFRFHQGYFPTCYDVKVLAHQSGPASVLKGGLQEMANLMEVVRVGQQHTAGSDALVTAHTFFKLKEKFFADNWDDVSKSTCGQLYGLGKTLTYNIPSSDPLPTAFTTVVMANPKATTTHESSQRRSRLLFTHESFQKLDLHNTTKVSAVVASTHDSIVYANQESPIEQKQQHQLVVLEG